MFGKRCFLFLAMVVCSAAQAQVVVREDGTLLVKAAEKTFQVTYESGQKDRFVYVFSAYVTSYMSQRGAPSPFNPNGTYRCDYRVGRYIRREGFYLTGNGERVPLNEVRKVFGPGTRAYRTNDPLQVSFANNSPCNKYVKDFNALKAKATADAIKDFDALMLTDIYTEAVADAESVMKSAKLQEMKD
jgi:hypothetical protein